MIHTTPLAALYYVTQSSEKATFKDDFVEFGFSPKSIGIVKEINEDYMRPIDAKFIPNSETREDKNAFSFIIDENFFNSFFSNFISKDVKASLREGMQSNPKMALFS